MSRPKVSIVIPVYNVQNYIQECFASIIQQTLSEIEIIVVNDGSTDKSIDVVKQYQKQDRRIVLIEQENSGLSIARNTGVEYATGEYILFVDSDDRVSLELCEKVYNKAKKEKLDVLLFYYYLVFEHTQVERKSYYTDKIIDGLTYIKNSLNNNMFSPPAWNKLIRTELAKSICFQPKYYYEDIEYSYSLLLCAKRVGVINDYLYYYCRFRVGAITQQLKWKHLNDLFEIFSIVERKIQNSGIYYMAESKEFKLHKYERISMEILYKLIDDSHMIKKSVQKILDFLSKDTSFRRLSWYYFKYGKSWKHKLVLIAFWVNPRIYIFIGRTCYPLFKKIGIAV